MQDLALTFLHPGNASRGSVWVTDPPGGLELADAAEQCLGLRSLMLGISSQPADERETCATLPRQTSRLTRLTSPMLQGVPLSGLPALAALSAIRRLSLLDWAEGGGNAAEPLRHPLLALSALDTLQVCKRGFREWVEAGNAYVTLKKWVLHRLPCTAASVNFLPLHAAGCHPVLG